MCPSGPIDRKHHAPGEAMIRPLVSWTACLPLVLSVALGACKGGKKVEESLAPPAGSAGSATGSRPAAAVTLQLNWTPEPEFGGFYAAAHDHLYEREGLNVTIKAGGAGVQTWKMVATGDVPFAIAEAGGGPRARAQGAPLGPPYAGDPTSPPGP